MNRNMRTAPKAKNFKQSISKLIPYIKPYLIWVILAIIFSIIGALSSLLGPKFLGDITKECQKAAIGIGIDYDKIKKIGVF